MILLLTVIFYWTFPVLIFHKNKENSELSSYHPTNSPASEISLLTFLQRKMFILNNPQVFRIFKHNVPTRAAHVALHILKPRNFEFSSTNFKAAHEQHYLANFFKLVVKTIQSSLKWCLAFHTSVTYLKIRNDMTLFRRTNDRL